MTIIVTPNSTITFFSIIYHSIFTFYAINYRWICWKIPWFQITCTIWQTFISYSHLCLNIKMKQKETQSQKEKVSIYWWNLIININSMILFMMNCKLYGWFKWRLTICYLNHILQLVLCLHFHILHNLQVLVLSILKQIKINWIIWESIDKNCVFLWIATNRFQIISSKKTSLKVSTNQNPPIKHLHSHYHNQKEILCQSQSVQEINQ
jgi:hypothetical protein